MENNFDIKKYDKKVALGYKKIAELNFSGKNISEIASLLCAELYFYGALKKIPENAENVAAALREKTAELWTKLNGVPITPDMISCTGCRIEGAKTPFCDKFCPVHNCVREKKLDTCADCEQTGGCPTLGQIAANSPFVLENLKRLREAKQ